MRLPCFGATGSSSFLQVIPDSALHLDEDVSEPAIFEPALRSGVSLNISIAATGVYFSCGSDGALALVHTGIVALRLCDSRPVKLSVLGVVDPTAQSLQLVVRSSTFSLSSAMDACDLLIELPQYLLQCDAITVSSRSFMLRVISVSEPVRSAAPATLLSLFVASVLVGDAAPEAQLYVLSTMSSCVAKDDNPSDLLLNQRLVSPFASNTGAVAGLASSVIGVLIIWATSVLAVFVFKISLSVPFDRAARWLHFPGLAVYAQSVLAPSILFNSLRLWFRLSWEISHNPIHFPSAVFIIVAGLLLSVLHGALVVFMANAASAAVVRDSVGEQITTVGLLDLHFVETNVWRDIRRRVALQRAGRRDFLTRLIAPQVTWLPGKAEAAFGPLFTILLPGDAWRAVAMWAQMFCLSFVYALPARTKAECCAVQLIAFSTTFAAACISAHALISSAGTGSYSTIALSWVHAGAQVLLVATTLLNVAYVLDERYRVTTGINPSTVGFCSVFGIISIFVIFLRVTAWRLSDRSTAWGVEEEASPLPLPVHVTAALEEELLKP
jgi:hypothetical protein